MLRQLRCQGHQVVQKVFLRAVPGNTVPWYIKNMRFSGTEISMIVFFYKSAFGLHLMGYPKKFLFIGTKTKI